MIFVCCAIKLLRSTFQLPSLALSLSTPLRGMESVYSHTERAGFRLSEEEGTAPCASLCSPRVCKVAPIPKQAGNDGLVPSTAPLFPTAGQFQQFQVLRAVMAAGTHSISSSETHVLLLSTSAPHSLEAFSPFLSCTLYYQTLFASTCCTCVTPEPCPASEPCEELLWYRTCCICWGCDRHTARVFCLFFALKPLLLLRSMLAFPWTPPLVQQGTSDKDDKVGEEQAAEKGEGGTFKIMPWGGWPKTEIGQS